MAPSELEIQIDEPTSDTVLVTLTGDVDAGTAPKLRDSLATTLFTHEPAQLVIDFAAVDFLDSVGVRVLIEVHRKQRDRDGKLVLTNMPAAPRRVLEVTGLTGTLELR